MKVLLLNQTFYPDRAATAQQIEDLALFLTQKNCEVTVVAERRSYESRECIHAAKEVYKGIKIYRTRSTGFGKKSFFLRFIDGITFEFFLLLRLLRLPKQDVVISFTSPPLIRFIGLLISFFWRARSVQWLMDINPDIAFAVGYMKPKAPLSRFLTAVLNLCLRHSEEIVVLDRWMKQKVLRHKVISDRIKIVPPWPAHDFEMNLGGVPKENAFRAEHGLQGKFVICYSGNHSIVHPLNTLLQAAYRLKDHKDIVFAFIGGGLRFQEVTDFVEKHKLSNVLQLPRQPRERLHESLTFPDLHVVIMGDEVSGLVHTSKIYGVLATGRPYIFIGPKESHITDLLAECPYGFHVEHGDEEKLIQVISDARKLTPEELTLYEKENLAYVATHYAADISMDAVAKKVLGIMSPEKEGHDGTSDRADPVVHSSL